MARLLNNNNFYAKSNIVRVGGGADKRTRL